MKKRNSDKKLRQDADDDDTSKTDLSSYDQSEEHKSHPKPNIHGDETNIAVLLFLYFLQGIPIGLCYSIPMLLQNRNVSYKEQAEFSFVYWPFSLKLLWAPIVDSLFIRRIGRRKTWLVPTQYLLGFAMFYLSGIVDGLLGEGTSGSPDVKSLTIAFFMLNFLAATQDIAVDGWALTMLHRRNVGYASTCNSVGQTAGYIVGYVVLIALESADFCNNYLRSTPSDVGILTLSGFLHFYGIVFLFATTFVWIFKHEKGDEEKHEELDVFSTYKVLFKILSLPSIRKLVLVLVTCKIGYAAAEAVTALKLVESGVPKAHLALLAIPLVPLEMLLPIVISRYTAGPQPMNVYLKAMPYRLICGVFYGFLLFITPSFKISDGQYPWFYYALVLVFLAAHQVTVYSMFVAVMAFFAKISDPAVGGTYMTLLNTVCNLGGNWPTTLALWAVDPLTRKSCQGVEDNFCRNTLETEACSGAGGSCLVQVDGYYVESVLCTVAGFLWLGWGMPMIRRLQSLPETSWKVPRN
uniref:EOG090X04K8 n=1 Tax=Lynceus sp. MCZ IZ 141354 TaxID=1930659 RepID=A0A9N6ZEI7_9CRUS|nr:EOG090X04K8 [Lynceus sp. MCZ IZ 141354]